MKTLDLHIIDITHNSIRAKADQIIIEIVDKNIENIFSIKIIDNGSGMNKETIDAINSTFYSSRKERKIGMGIALLKYHSELANGQFSIKSELGKGTEIYAIFEKNNIDRQPEGDLASCFANFICQYEKINFIIRYYTNENEFEISTKDVLEVFEGVDINNHQIISSLTELIKEGIGQQ